MSKRLRVEADRAKQLATDVQDEEDKIKLLKERIFAAIVWRRLTSGIKIQDLKANYFDDVLKIVEEHYITEEVLCRNSNLADDPTSKQSYLDRILFNLKNHSSIIALDENNDDAIAGFLVLKAVHKSDFGRVFSRVQLTDGEAYQQCTNFLNNLSRIVDVHATFHCDAYLRYYLLCIKPEYRRKGLGFQLMLTGINIARSLNIPVLMGVLSSFKLQKLGKKIGMRILHEINYVDWRDKYSEMIFDDPGAGNYTCAVMAGELPAVTEPPPPPKSKVVEDVTPPVKLTRVAKRKLKDKKASKANK